MVAQVSFATSVAYYSLGKGTLGELSDFEGSRVCERTCAGSIKQTRVQMDRYTSYRVFWKLS